MERRVRADLPIVGEGLVMPEGGWAFASVVETFEDHIRRSIPLCDEGRKYIAELSTFFINEHSIVYELGVSTGALAREVLQRNRRKGFTYVGIDIVPEMTSVAAQQLHDDSRFVAETADIIDYEFQTASLFLSYYTMQFIPPKRRQGVINRIYEHLEQGGAFLMHEKVRAPDARLQDILTQAYTEFKLRNEFSAEEIINKTKSLKGVLEPFSTSDNLALLSRARFRHVMIIQKFYCFEGYLAIK